MSERTNAEWAKRIGGEAARYRREYQNSTTWLGVWAVAMFVFVVLRPPIQGPASILIVVAIFASCGTILYFNTRWNITMMREAARSLVRANGGKFVRVRPFVLSPLGTFDTWSRANGVVWAGLTDPASSSEML